MSSIQPINVLDKQEFTKMNTNELMMNPYAASLNNVSYDSFSPSFKQNPKGFAKPLIGAAGEEGRGFMADLGKNIKGRVMKFIAALIMAGGIATTTTSCNKPLVDIDIVINQDYSALFDLLAQQMESNNQLHEDMLELQRLMREAILRLIANGETLEEINDHVVENGYHLEDLVAGQEELVELVKKLVAGMGHLEELGEGGNALGTAILQAILTMNQDQNDNYDALMAWLNNVLINKLDDMSEQDAAHHAAIINYMMQMDDNLQELQATLLQVLNVVSTLPEIMQSGYYALLAQLQGLSLQLGAGLIQLIAHIDQWGEAFQAQFNTLIQNFNNFSAQVQAGIAAILGRLDAVLHNQEAQQAQILQLINNVNHWGEAFMDQLNTLLAHFDEYSAEMQAGIMLIMAQMQTMQEAQAQQVAELLNNINHWGEAFMNQLNTLIEHFDQYSAQVQAGIMQILAKLNTMQQEQAQQVLNVINHIDQIGEALNTLLENFNSYSQQVQAGIMQILAKINGLSIQVQRLIISAVNIIGNQYTIISLMQQMRAEILAAYGQIIAHMGTIEQNQQANAEWLARIFVQLQNNGIQLSEINQFLQSVNFGPDVNLDVVVALLQQIIAQDEQHHNELLNNNNENTQLIVNAINLVKAKLTAMQNDFNTNFTPTHFAYLQSLLDAIEAIDLDGCECDCETIIELLEQIAEDIQSGIIHEGYEEEDPYSELGLDP